MQARIGSAPTSYSIYPTFELGNERIQLGYAPIAAALRQERCAMIDGFAGVLWDEFRQHLHAELLALGIESEWQDVSVALLPADGIEALVEPFLGGEDPIFGRRFTGTLRDFFDADTLGSLVPSDGKPLHILYGVGASLAKWPGPLLYVDLPKNELQFRARAGVVRNLGKLEPAPAKATYKRFYFVDWVVLNQHKAELLPKIDRIVDGQRPDEPASMTGTDLREGLGQMSKSFFRVRPWFEPGPWGGQWIKQKIAELPQDASNYAWSFELIAPENGLIFASSGQRLEVSFDFLMFQDHRAVLGDSADRFGFEFPIRFDFLDTFDGGNLSVQCHPRPEFIQTHFGESMPQDETYYILDCKPGAKVYLGFKEDIDAEEFRAELERSSIETTPIDIEQFVNSESANKHDLFLIPNGTIHCSGEDNLVLEISSTPYIFTFKMYDWLRLDLDGKPRPLNIGRAFENLDFSRKGAYVREKLVSRPEEIGRGAGWRRVHLPTHELHFYDVHRFEIQTEIEVETNGSPHVLSLVEGDAVMLETQNGRSQRFHYAETFVVPSAAGQYKLCNAGERPAWVVTAFIKPEHRKASNAPVGSRGR